MKRAIGGLVCLLASGPRAGADTPLATPAALEVDREAAPPGRPEFGFDGGSPLDGWAASVALGWLERPVVLRDGVGDSYPVERRQTLVLGAAFGIGEGLVLDVRMPLAHQNGARLRLAGGTGEPRALDRWVAGDLRVGGRARLVARRHGSAFVRGELSLPTGDAQDFAGEPSWTVAWSLIGRLTLPHGIVVAVTAGIRLRGAEVLIADRLVGDELVGGIGISVPIPPLRPLWCASEQVRVTGEIVGILGNEVGDRGGPSPAEVRVGLVTRPRDPIAIGVRIGTGLDDQIGAPRFRGTVEVAWRR